MSLSGHRIAAAFAVAAVAIAIAVPPRPALAVEISSQQCVPYSNACELYIAQLKALDGTLPPSASGTAAEAPLAVKCEQTARDGSHETAMLYDIEWATLVYKGTSVVKAQTQARKDHPGGVVADTEMQKCNALKLYKLK